MFTRRHVRERLWTPPGLNEGQLRNARVRLLGSAVLLTVLVVVVAARLI